MSSATPAPQGEVIVHVFGRTDVGRTREHNEDAFVVADLSTDNATLQPEVRQHRVGAKGSLFMVADGMGGAAAGEIASAMAVDIVLGELRTAWIAQPAQKTAGAEAFVRAIKQATKSANQQINAYAANHAEYRGMGTTATIAGILGDTLYLAQVGDSRAYLVRDGEARQITKDQSLMQKLIEAGELTEEEAAQSERRNIILQALGPEPTVKIDLTHQQVRRGDTLVLCSDGLSGQVTKDEIAAIVSQESDLTAGCKKLIDRANANGGPDNITVILARFDGAGLADPNGDDHVGHRVFPLPETGQTPAIGIDRLIDAHSPTQPVPVIERTRTTRPLPAEEMRESAPAAASAPTVSPARRNAGRMIAIGLLVLGIAAAAWFIVEHVRDAYSAGASVTKS
ncbi:MAG TPA: Stp1/IreP family PP2C-type Ser/Thr phosphatase [Gemmatimonadaceae bacterium]|nr:Stp1/IreP family PP2C-type Ser/Thr phosphatase [Gemmatimonadaceae bacterium]